MTRVFCFSQSFSVFFLLYCMLIFASVWSIFLFLFKILHFLKMNYVLSNICSQNKICYFVHFHVIKMFISYQDIWVIAGRVINILCFIYALRFVVHHFVYEKFSAFKPISHAVGCNYISATQSEFRCFSLRSRCACLRLQLWISCLLHQVYYFPLKLNAITPRVNALTLYLTTCAYSRLH